MEYVQMDVYREKCHLRYYYVTEPPRAIVAGSDKIIILLLTVLVAKQRYHTVWESEWGIM